MTTTIFFLTSQKSFRWKSDKSWSKRTFWKKIAQQSPRDTLKQVLSTSGEIFHKHLGKCSIQFPKQYKKLHSFGKTFHSVNCFYRNLKGGFDLPAETNSSKSRTCFRRGPKIISRSFFFQKKSSKFPQETWKAALTILI